VQHRPGDHFLQLPARQNIIFYLIGNQLDNVLRVAIHGKSPAIRPIFALAKI
jgi:hypothetical protein